MKLRDYDPDYIAYAEERGEQIREDRLDDLGRCEYALQQTKQRAEELEQILDACEAANAKHLARIDHLEGLYWKMWGENEELKQLCRDLYLCFMEEYVDYAGFTNRMKQLGLLDGEQND